MLAELLVEDLGLIEATSLVLGPGLTALTGETGAGKTLLVEAIGLLVGGRVDATVVRHGAKEARVEGRFLVGDDEMVLARVVAAEGRSRAYVNGRLATVGTLVEEGMRLVDLHGQHAHQSLLATSTQRRALDRFGGIDLGHLRDARGRVAAADMALARLGGDARARAREIELLQYQLAELDAAGALHDDEDDVLREQEDLLADAQAHREAAGRAVEALAEDGGALDAVGVALAAVHARSPFLDIDDRLRTVSAELADVASALRHLGESIEDDPRRLGAIRERRQLLRELRRKYGDTLADVTAYHRDVAGRLVELEGHAESVRALEQERAEAQSDEAAQGALVAQARRSAAPGLAAAVQAHLAELAMPQARLDVIVDGDDPGDDVRFLLAANPGEPALPMAKVASGGELARAMLALRLVLTEAPDTLVFDEVDAGIGGEAALAVGRSLNALGRRHQVLVVTHLAQVAAFADEQVAVTKAVRDGRTTAVATALDADARVVELSRMLSGLAGGDPARRHAAELLDAARAAARGQGRRSAR
jgi:DNA repair protein RecN (Recombination protein N)